MEKYKKGEPKKREGYGKSIFNHSYCRRKKDHDYKAPCTYHLILKKDPLCDPFGRPAGNPEIAPETRGGAFILHSALGKIVNQEIFSWPKKYPVLKVYQHIVMPDHVHILVRVLVRIPKAFGHYVNKLKGAIKWRWNETKGTITPSIFIDNFTDLPIFGNRSLSDIIIYIRHNPHRLAMRIMHPEFFQRVRNIRIGDELWQAYGNLFFLRNPFKVPVIVHRADSEQQKEEFLEFCLENVRAGGVVVSAFIAEHEKRIRDEVNATGGRMIHIQDKPFGERFKPEKSRFEQCSEGRLLILAPMEPLKLDSRRAICLHLNEIAIAISEGRFQV